MITPSHLCLICSFVLATTFALGQAEIHDWTNKEGRTIRAKFVRGDEETVTIVPVGSVRNYIYKLSDLSGESQALARKLTASPPSPTGEPETPLAQPTPAVGQSEIHVWTNKEGRPIRATFMRGDEETVTIFVGGRNFVYKLSDLSEESQALARKLSATPPAPAGEPEPEPGIPPAPVPAKPEGPKGKLLLPTLGSGKWATYHSVLEGSTHDVALHGNGKFYIHLKDGSDNLLRGNPLVLQFHQGYYTKPHPRASNHAYHTSRPEYNYHFRKIVGFKNPPKPSEKLGRVKLTAELEGGSLLEMGFEASSRRIAIWGEADDPSSIDHPTVIALRLAIPDSIRVNDADGQDQWKPIVGDSAIEVVTVAGSKETLSYLEQWTEMRKKLTFYKGIQSGIVSGKLLGRRKVTVAPKSLRNAYFSVGSYSGVFPFQHYHFYLRDREGGKIDKSGRLEIEIK